MLKSTNCSLTIALGLVALQLGYGQQPSPNQPTPLSPNAASIAKYGDTGVQLYSGQPNVSVPIYEINTGYLKVPIVLSYNYNGLKVEDYPGWVGTGWTLNVPSVITRQVRGLRVIGQTAYLNVTPELGSFFKVKVTPDPGRSCLTSYSEVTAQTTPALIKVCKVYGFLLSCFRDTKNQPKGVFLY